jgi:hypothetical protein
MISKTKSLFFAILVNATVANCTPDASLEFGSIPIGQAFNINPDSVIAFRDCDNVDKLETCEIQLKDGVWYTFENKILVIKRLYDLDKSSSFRYLSGCKFESCVNLIKSHTGLEFDVIQDDDGSVLIKTKDMIRRKNGVWTSILLIFKNGSIEQIVDSPLPDN